MRLQPSRLRFLQFQPDALDLRESQDLRVQGLAFDEGAQAFPDRGVDDQVELGPHPGVLAVPDRSDEQVAERLALEGLAENIEDLPAVGPTLLLDLVEQPQVDLPFTGALGDQVPHVADLALADAVNPAEALLDAIGVCLLY